MTALERVHRRKAKASFLLRNKNPFPKLAESFWLRHQRRLGLGNRNSKQKKYRSMQDRVLRPRGDGDNNDDPIRIRLDPVTTQAIQYEVQKLLRDTHGSSGTAGTTVYCMANVLGSKTVVDYYCDNAVLIDDEYDYDDSDDDYEDGHQPLRSLEQISRSLHEYFSSSSSSSYSKKAKQRRLERKYRLVDAMHRLQQTSGSNSARISSWQEAQLELSRVVSFPSPQTATNQEGGDEGKLVVLGTASARDNENDNVSDDAVMEKYRKRFEEIHLAEELHVGLMPSQRLNQQVAHANLAHGRAPTAEEAAAASSLSADALLQVQLDDAYAQRQARLDLETSAALQQAEEALRQQERDEEAVQRAATLLRPLSEEDALLVRQALHSMGPETEIVASEGADTCQRGSIQRLLPGQWLNDEVISFFMVMLSKRDAELCALDSSRKHCHFFKSFFMTKLLNEGHANRDMDGVYEYQNVKRWSKKVVGKDIFKLDKIFFPVNISQMHWICLAIFVSEKRIQAYDSFGDDHQDYLDHLFRYLQDEHLDKKKVPLPDLDQWQLVTCRPDTPRQRNGYDCGVFTCMFADFLSMGYPLTFDQSHVTQCRERIALSILKGRAIV